MKTCKDCNKDLPREEFYTVSAHNKDVKCKSCRKIYNRAYQTRRYRLKTQRLW